MNLFTDFKKTSEVVNLTEVINYTFFCCKKVYFAGEIFTSVKNMRNVFRHWVLNEKLIMNWGKSD